MPEQNTSLDTSRDKFYPASPFVLHKQKVTKSFCFSFDKTDMADTSNVTYDSVNDLINLHIVLNRCFEQYRLLTHLVFRVNTKSRHRIHKECKHSMFKNLEHTTLAYSRRGLKESLGRFPLHFKI